MRDESATVLERPLSGLFGLFGDWLTMGFRDVPSRYDGTQLEGQVLDLWRQHDVFNAAQEQSEGRPLYVWNEGPPTANGRPGIHPVLART